MTKGGKRKSKGAILHTAITHILGYKGNYYWGERIYNILKGVWENAFTRGYEKALRDFPKEKP